MKKIRLLPLVITSFLIVNIALAADEIHWTITGQDSVTFDWRGTALENSIGYGLSPGVYTQITAQSPDPVPSSSQGPFWEAKLTGLKENTRYYYSIGNGPERTFHTAPYRGSSDFTIYAQGNIGDTTSYFNMGVIQDLITNDQPAFVIGLGDLTLDSNNGKAAVDQHFNDVMAWSKEVAYMPVWGDLDWSGSSTDSFNNYKGRFDVPNSQTSPNSPLAGGKDWYWFDYGNTRFITLPEPWSGAWSAWNTKADALMAQAQADPDIKYIVTFAHQPAYSSGHYTGSATLRGMLDTLGDTHSKYVLNVNAHSVNYERSHPQHGVVHITAGIGGANLEQDGPCLWLTCSQPSWSAYRAMHQGALKLHFTGSGIEGSFICGPAGGGSNDVNCTKGSVVDKFMIDSPTAAASASNSVTSAVASAEPMTTSIAPMTVSAAPMMRASTSTTTNFLGNPGFESGATTWVQSGSVISSSTSQPARSGTWKADLNGFGYVSTESFYQTVTIPATVTSATLSFWLRIGTAETTTSTAYDKLSVQVQNSSGTVLKTLATYSNLDKNTGYVQKSFDLSSYKGQTIRLSIKGTEDYSLKTSFVLDDFVLGEGSTPTTTPQPTTPPPTTSARGEAFPGAQGGGAASVGGRGGAVIEVTNLNDSGTGSLRACVAATGPRTCVFRVSGTIKLSSTLRVGNPYLTVAGQTSPGGGVSLSGVNKTVGGMVQINAHDVIWRYTRVRNGTNSSCSSSDCGGNIMVYDGYNIMVDHNTSQWNMDDGIGAWNNSAARLNNVTFSWNLVAEGLASHPTGSITGSSSSAKSDLMTNVDYHHNLMMNNSHRDPLLKHKSARYVNNLHYNTYYYMNQYIGGISADVIGNVYKQGPMTPTSMHEVQAGVGNSSTASGSPSIYLSGNKGWHQTNSAGDQWLLANQSTGENGSQIGAIPSAWRRTSPLANSTFPIVAEPVAGLEANTLPIVGASRKLDCSGTWVINRDTSEVRMITQYQNNTGITSLPVSENSVGGFPAIASGTPCADADHDGMPDVWETARGLNPNNAADRNTVAGNGYTNLENYLNGV